MAKELPKDLKDFGSSVNQGGDSMLDLLREIRDLLATLPQELKQALMDG